MKMKKQIMYLSLAACCGVAFAQTDYKVTFTTDRTDITTIYLCSEEDGTVLDSASCHNGKAVMDGQTRLPPNSRRCPRQKVQKPNLFVHTGQHAHYNKPDENGN